jgi:hypothetical protein
LYNSKVSCACVAVESVWVLSPSGGGGGGVVGCVSKEGQDSRKVEEVQDMKRVTKKKEGTQRSNNIRREETRESSTSNQTRPGCRSYSEQETSDGSEGEHGRDK